MSGPDPNPTGAPLIPSAAISFAAVVDSPDERGEDKVHVEERDMPFDGVVSQVYIDIPDGVRSRAGFNIKDDERGIKRYPYDEDTTYASFNNVRDFWPVSFPMEEGDTIQVNYINENWNVENHLLKVWAIVVGEEALPYTLDELAQRDGAEFQRRGVSSY